MAMWKIIVKPIETPHAWEMLFRDGGFVAIGFAGKDDDASVKLFRHRVQIGDWVLAHLPATISGTPHLVAALGQVTGDYSEGPPSPGQKWNGPLMRRRDVEWIRKRHLVMPLSVRRSNYRRTVARLRPDQERDVLREYGITQ